MKSGINSGSTIKQLMIITSDGHIPSKYAHSFNVMKMTQGFYDAGESVLFVSFLSWPNIRERWRIKNIHNFYGISPNISLKMLPIFNKSFWTDTIGGKEFNIKAAKYIRKQNPNFVYCRSYLTPYYCVNMGVPCIVETHTTAYDLPDLQKVYEVAGNPHFLGLITIHENIKKEHIKRGIPEKKILVLEDGVDLARFQISDDKCFWRDHLGLPEDKSIVMYSGGLYKEKGIEDILLSAKRLQHDPQILFVLVGGREEEIAAWKAFTKDHGINNVIFPGFVNNSDVPKYLKAADVLMMPYNTTVQYQVMDINSTSPLKLFEYMASQRPIVSSNIPVISKIVSHNQSAMLAETNNVDRLVDYVGELLHDQEKRMFLAKNAYTLVQQYEWKKRCKVILDTFIGKG